MLKPKEGDRGVYYSRTEAKNYPIQGFATGDLMPLIICILAGYSTCKYYMCTTVHDSVLLDVPLEQVYNVLACIESVFFNLPTRFKDMFNYDLKVHYDYDVSMGGNWKEYV
jgi:hypothetical protein